MSTPFVIGVGHKARHGKDTFTKIVMEEFGSKYSIKRIAFGDALKLELYDALCDQFHPYWDSPMSSNKLLLPVPELSFPTREQKLEWIERNRAAIVRDMQLYGTEYARAKDPFYWVKAYAEELRKLNNVQIVITPDVRFKNEFFFIKAMGGATVKVTRTGYEDPNRDPKHLSEVDLDGVVFDYCIEVPSGAMDELRRDSLQVFEMIVERLTPEVPEAGIEIV